MAGITAPAGNVCTQADIGWWILEGARARECGCVEALPRAETGHGVNCQACCGPSMSLGVNWSLLVLGHPALRIGRHLVDVSVQLGEVIERIRAAWTADDGSGTRTPPRRMELTSEPDGIHRRGRRSLS